MKSLALLVVLIGFAMLIGVGVYVLLQSRDKAKRSVDERRIAPESATDMRRIGTAMADLLYEGVADPMYRVSDDYADRARTLRAEWRGDSQ